jgi:hypothetical protein
MQTRRVLGRTTVGFDSVSGVGEVLAARLSTK